MYRDGDVTLPSATTVTLATMANVAPGAYVVMAKTTLVQTITAQSGGGTNLPARCTLNGDPVSNTATDDWAEVELGRGEDNEIGFSETGRATLHTQVTTNLGATGSFVLRCRNTEVAFGNPNEPVVARETKIIAIKVDTASRTAVSG